MSKSIFKGNEIRDLKFLNNKTYLSQDIKFLIIALLGNYT